MSRGVLGGVWAVLGALLDHFGSLETIWANFGRPQESQNGANMGPRGAKMGQVGAKMVQDGQVEGKIWPT